MNSENQNIEYKEIWKDEYLKWVCGFANAKGGILYIGINDSGQVVGINNFKKLLKDLPNKIADILGIMVEVNLLSELEFYYIEIIVKSSSNPISYNGRYYYRTGSTVKELKGSSLEKLLLKRIGRKWDSITADGFSFEDLSIDAINLFRKKASKSKRVPIEDLSGSIENLIELLGLTENNSLKRSAIIAFGKNPEKLITGAYVKIGFFRTHSDLLYQDEIHGSLFEQVEKTMDLLTTKYMRANIAYEGLTRTETYDYPEEALREALLNALIHKDYSSSNPVQISVYGNWMMIYNNGELPENWTIETLTEKHASEPANPEIAKVFFRAGYIEIWGRGITNLINYCTNVGLPKPYFRKMGPGLAIVFEKEKGNSNFGVIEEETTQETLGKNSEETSGTTQETSKTTQETSGTTQEILELIKKTPKISKKEITVQIGDITEDGVKYHINKLKKEGILKHIGPTKGGYWEVKTLGTTQETSKSSEEISGTTQEILGTTQETLGTTQEILELIKKTPKISKKEITVQIGDITEDGVKYHINKLKKDGILKHIGPTKGGYWEVVDKSKKKWR